MIQVHLGLFQDSVRGGVNGLTENLRGSNKDAYTILTCQGGGGGGGGGGIWYLFRQRVTSTYIEVHNVLTDPSLMMKKVSPVAPCRTMYSPWG